MPDEQDTPKPQEPTPPDAGEPTEPTGSTPQDEPTPDQPDEPAADEGAKGEVPEEVDEDLDSVSPEDEAAALAAAVEAINQVQGVADSVGGDLPDGAQPFAAPEFGDPDPEQEKHRIDLLSDVHMDVRIELGRTRMYVEDVLRLSDGAVVELDKLAGDPVDVFVNDRRVARGEVLVLNDMFCVRISEVVDITTSEE